MTDLNYHHLRYFHAVAHDGNLTRTAKRLNVSQSALSAQIRQLEARLGQELFERLGRQLLLTEAGRIALDHADAIFATGAELVGTLADRPDAVQRVIRVGAIATLSRNFQLRFLRPILGREGVSITVHSGRLGDLLHDLEAHALDVILANHLPPRDKSTPWLAHKIAEQPVSIVGSRKRLRRRDTALSLLEREPVLLPAIETTIRTSFDAYVNRLGIRPEIVAEVDDMAMLRLLARENIGIAIVPPIVVTDELAAGTLAEAKRIPDLTETFYAIILKRRFPNPLLQDLICDALK